MDDPCVGGATDDALAIEKIGLRRIKLMRSENCATAVVGSFVAADKLLLSWYNSSIGRFKCEFEVEYIDEHVLKGEYRALRRRSECVSLSLYIRSAFRRVRTLSTCNQDVEIILFQEKIRFFIGQDHVEINAELLERFEIDDRSKA